MKNFTLGFLSVLILMIIAGGAYYLGLQKSVPVTDKISITPSVIDKEPLAVTPNPTYQVKPKIDVSEQIKSAIASKNTQALEGYMADTVQVKLEGSECCGTITKAEAISQLSYLNPAVNWNFDPANPILINLAKTVPNYYGSGWIVGVASNEYLASFKLNGQNKIEAYNLASTYKLLIK